MPAKRRVDFLEQPWIAERAARDGDAVAAGFAQHSYRILRGEDIAVSDDGNLHGILYRVDIFRMCSGRVQLGAGACVDAERGGAGCLHSFRHFDDVDRMLVPAETKLDRDGNPGRIPRSSPLRCGRPFPAPASARFRRRI